MITALDANFGLIVSGGKDNLVKVWDIKTKKAFTFTKHMNVVTQAMAWDETSALTASADRSIRYWDIKDPNESKYLKSHGASVTQIKRLNHSSNRAVSASIDTTVKIWDVFSGTCLNTYEGHCSGVQRIAMNPMYLASYSDSDGLLMVRDFEKGSVLLKVQNFQELLGF